MLVAIEGIDGCGKGTQTQLLSNYAKENGISVTTFSFPRYGNNAYALATARYLNGEFGGVSDVPPEFAALLYAGDRLAARAELLDALDTHDLVICDRFVPSNLAHQGAKLTHSRRRSFLDWLSEIEYGIHCIPKADISVLLDMPVTLASELVKQKKQRGYTSLKADIHEADARYLDACAEVYKQLSMSDADRWLIVACTNSAGQLTGMQEITGTIWSALAERFPELSVANTK